MNAPGGEARPAIEKAPGAESVDFQDCLPGDWKLERRPAGRGWNCRAAVPCDFERAVAAVERAMLCAGWKEKNRIAGADGKMALVLFESPGSPEWDVMWSIQAVDPNTALVSWGRSNR